MAGKHVFFLGQSPEYDHVSVEPRLDGALAVDLFLQMGAKQVAITESSTLYSLPKAENADAFRITVQQAMDTVKEHVPVDHSVIMGFGGAIISFASAEGTCATDNRAARFQQAS